MSSAAGLQATLENYALSTTPLTRYLALVMVIGYLVQYISPDVESILALVPGKTSLFVWQLVTAGVVHLTLLSVR